MSSQRRQVMLNVLALWYFPVFTGVHNPMIFGVNQALTVQPHPRTVLFCPLIQTISISLAGRDCIAMPHRLRTC